MKPDNDNKLPFRALDNLPLFASDREIAVAVVGKARAGHWERHTLPLLETKGFCGVANLPAFRRVDAVEPYPLAMDLDCVAVNDSRLPLYRQGRRSCQEEDGKGSG